MFKLASPVDGQPLSLVGGMLATPDGTQSFPVVDSIPHLIRPEVKDAVDAFSAAYGAVRSAEGRRSETADYYRALPYEDLSGNFEQQWSQRAATLDSLVAELGSCPLEVIDAGAGNCWLSARLAAAGHCVLAIDVNVDTDDGLGCRVHYPERFEVARAELSHIPVASASVDVVVFNASVHYAVLVEVVAEACRVLRPGGRVVIADSPVYRDASAGMTMIDEMNEYISGLGVAPAQYEGRGFITQDDLFRTGLRWRNVTIGRSRSWGRANRSALRGWVARRRAGRELATLSMLIASPHGLVRDSVLLESVRARNEEL